MYIVKRYPDGIFCWVDLSTTDTEAAKKFYGGLFGWQFVDEPTGMGTVYTMCQIEGKNVAGLGPMPEEMQAQGAPPFWTSYVKHDNVDAVSARVTEAGGNVMMPPMDVMETGRMFLASDPTGAVFGVWQPKSHIGAQIVNSLNTLFWNELQTRDVEAAKSFYSTVFGWGHDEDENGYVAFKTDERVHSGMIQIDDTWGPVPANWAVYFLVVDVNASTEKVIELGGNVLVPLREVGAMGSFSVVQDPQGGAFTIMQSSVVDIPLGVE